MNALQISELDEILDLQSLFSNWRKIIKNWSLNHIHSKARGCGGDELCEELITKGSRFNEILVKPFWVAEAQDSDSVPGKIIAECKRERDRSIHEALMWTNRPEQEVALVNLFV